MIYVAFINTDHIEIREDNSLDPIIWNLASCVNQTVAKLTVESATSPLRNILTSDDTAQWKKISMKCTKQKKRWTNHRNTPSDQYRMARTYEIIRIPINCTHRSVVTRDNLASIQTIIKKQPPLSKYMNVTFLPETERIYLERKSAKISHSEIVPQYQPHCLVKWIWVDNRFWHSIVWKNHIYAEWWRRWNT